MSCKNFRLRNISQSIREECLKANTDMAFETVFSTEEKLEFIQRAKISGYFIRLFFICTNDPSINAQRIALRVMEGGHDVPIPKIISRYYRSIANSVEAIKIVDRAYFYDNSENDVDPQLIFRVSNNNTIKKYKKTALWSEEIIESIK